MPFNTMLKTLRLKKGLTQGELAKLTGLTRSAIGMYESGNREPKYEVLELLADFFNVDMNTLLDRPQNDNEDIRRMVCKIEADPNLRAYIKELEKNPKLVTLGRLSAKTTDAGLESILAVTKQIVKTSGCDDIDPEL
ncbi:helix-turn-helix transcriptional regulator [Phascolarctobacterium succinatutens]|uniref:helix-turn-helix domain-containing protein n=1 Tax=Phascolarctobacterium succinatutens TaxID=626940 RepID=UPI003076C2E9